MKSSCLAACLLLLAGTTSAETLSLSLHEAVQRALSEGTRMKLARSTAERAAIARQEALHALYPQADAELQHYSQSINLETFGFTIPGQPPVVGPFPVTDANLTAAVQVFNLAAYRMYQARSQGAAASRFQLQQAENDVATAVGRLYVLVQRADAQIASRQADVKLFQDLVRVAEDQFQAGTGTKLDIAQANVQLSRSRQALLVAENDRATTVVALLNAIGADQADDVVLTDALPAPLPAPPLADSVAAAQTGRPELAALQAREREAEFALSSAKAQRMPRLAVSFSGDYSGNHTNDLLWTRRIGAGVTLPLFHAQIPANIARARLDLEDVRTQADAARRDVEQDVRRSVLNLQNAEARVAVATETATVAEDALRIARDRKESGYGSAVEVDRAEDTYRQAHEDLIAARADAALAQLEYEHATGTIVSTSVPAAAPPEGR